MDHNLVLVLFRAHGSIFLKIYFASFLANPGSALGLHGKILITLSRYLLI